MLFFHLKLTSHVKCKTSQQNLRANIYFKFYPNQYICFSHNKNCCQRRGIFSEVGGGGWTHFSKMYLFMFFFLPNLVHKVFASIYFLRLWFYEYWVYVTERANKTPDTSFEKQNDKTAYVKNRLERMHTWNEKIAHTYMKLTLIEK